MTAVPATRDAYLELIHQALEEVEDLRRCADDDMEEMERYLPFLDQLTAQLHALQQAAARGQTSDPNEDLPFMPIVVRFGRDIPFRSTLEALNKAHRAGLGTGI